MLNVSNNKKGGYMKFQIFDWASNRIDQKQWPSYWATFEDAEEDLGVWLGGKYESDRGEYYIEQVD